LQRRRESEAAAAKVKAERRAEGSALNDNCKAGIDRFGCRAHAQAMANMLANCIPPLCIGLYAKWGSGKSFMIFLIKTNMDPTCRENPRTFEQTQWFEPGYGDMAPPASDIGSDGEDSPVVSRWTLLRECVDETCLSSLVPTMPYYVHTLAALVGDMYADAKAAWRSTMSRLVAICRGRRARAQSTMRFHYSMIAPEDSQPRRDVEMGAETEEKKEYVFVDYNAWEFNRTDELWTGIIRNIYTQVERRLEVHRTAEGMPVDYKQKWRVKKAKKTMIENYGGVAAVRLRLVGIVVLSWLLMAALVAAVIYRDYLGGLWRQHLQRAVVVIVSCAVLLGTLMLPAMRLVMSSKKESGTDMGEQISAEADGAIHDRTGFMSKVRRELDELFSFIATDFKEETGTTLTLVLFVDDLDRCIGGGRIVKVLEAIQLLLNIPGAPVIVFLAIDSRIVVSSIEDTFNRSMNLSDTRVTGWEYLDKIIQLPFCMPEPPVEKVQQLISSCLTGKDNTVAGVAEKLRDFLVFLFDDFTAAEAASIKVSFSNEDFASRGTGEERVQHDLESLRSSLSKACSDDQLVDVAASTFTPATRRVWLLQKSPGLSPQRELLVEVKCQRIMFALLSCKFEDSKLAATSTILHSTGPEGEQTCADDSVGQSVHVAASSADKPEPPEGKSTAVAKLPVVNERLQSKIMLMRPLVPLTVKRAVEACSLFADTNARRAKRIGNILQLICETAKCKPVSVGSRETLSSLGDPWDELMVKIVKFVYLSECFPYRTSFLVLVLLDFEQKKTFNRTTECLFRFDRVVEIDLDNMRISDFYFKYVHRLLFVSKELANLQQLDGDPELFALQLGTAVPFARGGREAATITCRDILGPLTAVATAVKDGKNTNEEGAEEHQDQDQETSGERDSNFSILTHALNLNPAIRHHISTAMDAFSSKKIGDTKEEQDSLLKNILGIGVSSEASLGH